MVTIVELLDLLRKMAVANLTSHTCKQELIL